MPGSRTDEQPVLTWLYVPGDRPDRFDKAAASGADMVILDWEDAVPVSGKVSAREHTLAWLRSRGDGVPVEVRVNAPASPWHAEDLATLAGVPGLASVRLPKVEHAAEVRTAAGILGPEVSLTCVLESALGVHRAFEIATAASQVSRIGLGEADLSADLGTAAPEVIGWCRTSILVTARAAGLPAPAMAAYPVLGDQQGLLASCRQGREHGMLGRAAVHPAQLPVIRAGFRPPADEVDRAREVVAAFVAAVAAGAAVVRDRDGRMLDEAVVRSARRTVWLAEVL